MLKVIGAGISRTGTFSFKLAMEKLGFIKCHHMMEVIDNPEQATEFLAAARGEQIDWKILYRGYQACCDFPSCYFWHELMGQFPEAKVVLTVRDPESWYKSMSETILPSLMQSLDTFGSPTAKMGEELIKHRFLGDRLDDKTHVIDAFNRHNQAVRDTVPADRLLEFDARQGWEPLCAFLGVPVPDEPYPKTNSLDEFLQKAARVT